MPDDATDNVPHRLPGSVSEDVLMELYRQIAADPRWDTLTRNCNQTRYDTLRKKHQRKAPPFDPTS